MSNARFYSLLGSLTVCACLTWLVWRPAYAIAWYWWVLGSYALCVIAAFGLYARARGEGEGAMRFLDATFGGGVILLFDALMVGAPIYFVLTSGWLAAVIFAAVGFIGALLLGSYIHRNEWGW